MGGRSNIGRCIAEETYEHFLCISAPALCGKSKFLEEVQSDAKLHGWQVALITLKELAENEVCSLDGFRNYVSQQLNLKDYATLVDLMLGDSDEVKILLLIDDVDTTLLSKDLELQKYFIKMLNSFKKEIVGRNEHGRHIFRVVIAGRYLDSEFVKAKIPPLDFFKGVDLHTFKKIEIRETILDSIRQRGVSVPNKETCNTWCKHIEHLSCEHPQAAITLINHIVNERAEGKYLDNDYIMVNKKRLFQEYVSPILDKMFEGLTVEERATLMVLSVFNRFDSSTLGELNTHLKNDCIQRRIKNTELESDTLVLIYRRGDNGHGFCFDSMTVKLLRKKLELHCEDSYPEISSQYLHSFAVEHLKTYIEKSDRPDKKSYFRLQAIYHSLQLAYPLYLQQLLYFAKQEPTRDFEDFKNSIREDKNIQELVEEKNLPLEERLEELQQALNNDRLNT